MLDLHAQRCMLGTYAIVERRVVPLCTDRGRPLVAHLTSAVRGGALGCGSLNSWSAGELRLCELMLGIEAMGP